MCALVPVHRLSPQCIAGVKRIKALLLARIGLLLMKAEKHGLVFQKFPLTTAKGFRGLKCCKCRNSCFLAGVVPESESKLANVVCLRCTFPKKKGYKRHGRGAVLVSANLRPDDGLSREACVRSGPCETGFNFVTKLVERLYGPELDSDNSKKRKIEEQDGRNGTLCRKITRVVFRVPQLPQNANANTGPERSKGLVSGLASSSGAAPNGSDPSANLVLAAARLPMPSQARDSRKCDDVQCLPGLPASDTYGQELSDVDTAMHAVDEAVEASIAGVLDAVCERHDAEPEDMGCVEDSAMPDTDCQPLTEWGRTGKGGISDSCGQSLAVEATVLEDTGHRQFDGAAVRQIGASQTDDIGALKSVGPHVPSCQQTAVPQEKLESNTDVLLPVKAVTGEAMPSSGHLSDMEAGHPSTLSSHMVDMSHELCSVSDDAPADPAPVTKAAMEDSEYGSPSPGLSNIPSRTRMNEDSNAGMEGTPCQGPVRHVQHNVKGTPDTEEHCQTAGTIVSPPCCESAKGGVCRPHNCLSSPSASRTPCHLLQTPFKALEEVVMPGLDGQTELRRTILTHEDSPGEKYLLLEQLLASLYPSKTHQQEKDLWQRTADVARRFGVKVDPPGWGWYNDRMEYILAESDVLVLHAALEGFPHQEQKRLRHFVDGVWFDSSDLMDEQQLMGWVGRFVPLIHDTI
eukprot:evm.model.scf_403.2 EVM.evm.TU.scf_403.2   scf_403:15396-17453(+)